MKSRIILAFVIATSASPAIAGDCPEPHAPLVCGHRGTGVTSPDNPFPENTLPSFQQAVTEGAAMVELDVMHSADGALVVIHDDTVDRTTDGSGCVGDMTLEQLAALDAGAGSSLAGTGVAIPTLADVLEAVEAAVNVEIKLPDSAACPEPDRALLAADVVDLIHARPDRTVVVSSFDAEVLTAVHALDPEVYVGFLGLDPAADTETALAAGFDAINPFFLGVTPEVVAAAHDAGLEVNPWTVDDVTFLGLMVDAGVDSIITDEPDLLVALLEERASAPCEPDPVEPVDAGGADATNEVDAGGGADAFAAEDADSKEDEPAGDAEAAADVVAEPEHDAGSPGGATSADSGAAVGSAGGSDGGCATARGDGPVSLALLALLLLALASRAPLANRRRGVSLRGRGRDHLGQSE